MTKICRCIFLSVIFIAVSASAQGTPNLIWQRNSGAEDWVPNAVTLANQGTLSGMAVGPLTDYTRIFSNFDSSSPQALINYLHPKTTLHHHIVGANSTDQIVTMFDEPIVGSPGLYNVVIRSYSLQNPAGNWSYTWPVQTNGHDNIELMINRDGTKIVAAVYNIYTNSVDLKTFGANSSTPVLSFSTNIISQFRRAVLSADGSRLAIGNNLSLKVFNTDTAQELTSILPFINIYRGIAISGDGSVLAFGSDNLVKIYRRNSTNQSYTLANTHNLVAGSYCNLLAISDDSSTLVLAADYPNAPENFKKVTVRAIELNTYTTLMEDTLQSPNSTLQSISSDLAITAKGDKFALGTWGDSLGLVPEVRIYNRNQNVPAQSIDLPGSVYNLDLSADGRRLLVASKALHANTVSGGGSVRLYEIGSLDVTIAGVPHNNGTVTVRLRGQPGTPAKLLMAPTLAANPIDFGLIGTLFLNRTTLTLIPVGTFDATGAINVNFSVPPGIGTALSLQAYSSNPRRLGHDWVKLTTLP